MLPTQGHSPCLRLPSGELMSRIDPPLFNQDPLRRRIVITLHMRSVAEHFKQFIGKTQRRSFPFSTRSGPIRATGDMLLWYVVKACEHVNHSQINMAIFDSRWEASEALSLIAARSWLLGQERSLGL